MGGLRLTATAIGSLGPLWDDKGVWTLTSVCSSLRPCMHSKNPNRLAACWDWKRTAFLWNETEIRPNVANCQIQQSRRSIATSHAFINNLQKSYPGYAPALRSSVRESIKRYCWHLIPFFYKLWYNFMKACIIKLWISNEWVSNSKRFRSLTRRREQYVHCSTKRGATIWFQEGRAGLWF